MTAENDDAPEASDREENAEAALHALVAKHAFGPTFFLGQLAAFVRDCCPDPQEHLPLVELHLQDGALLDVCHVIGVAPHWVALAIREHDERGMVTVLVPYEQVVRIDIRAGARGPHRVGFAQERAPVLVDPNGRTPEELLRLAAESRRA